MTRKEFLTYLFFHGIKESKKTKNQYHYATNKKGVEYYIRLRPKQNTISFYSCADTWTKKESNIHFQKKFYSYDLALKKIIKMREVHGSQ